MTGDGPKMVHFGPKEPYWTGLSFFQSGPKGQKMVNLTVFGSLGTIFGPSEPFWTISDKNDFLAPKGQLNS